MGGLQRKHILSKVPVSILSVTVRNKLVTKEVNMCNSGHMPQQAGYQGSSILVVARTPHHWKHVTIYSTNNANLHSILSYL
jgi:hypothetical protein